MVSKKDFDELTKKLEDSIKLSEERLKDVQYLQADFENLRKHFDKEKSHIIQLANEGLMKELLPVLDDFNAMLKITEDKGMRSVYDKLIKVLKGKGLNEIASVGEVFDSNLHEVVFVKQGEDDKILQEVSKGYVLNGKTIRTSKVIVGKKEE